ncbi:MAG TPA: CDP-alcohol phosphatidyltransferase family protein [Coriobacteriia bacterium]
MVEPGTRDASGSSRAKASPRAPGAVDHSADVVTWANVVTVLRLALIPFFYWALVWGGNDDLAFGLFLLTASTDWLDGLIARRTGTVTNIGKIIDPLVDRLLIAASLIGLYVVGRVGLWLLLVLVARDVYLLYGAWVLERHGRRLSVTMMGKVTTFVLMSGFGGLVWDKPWLPVPELATVSLGPVHFVLGGARPLGAYLAYAGLALSLTAAAQYTIAARREYREVLAEERARGAAVAAGGMSGSPQGDAARDGSTT